MEHEMKSIVVETIDLPLEDGGVITCAILDEFEIEDKNYIILAPVEEEGVIGDEVIPFICAQEGEDLMLEPIEDQVEYTIVLEAFKRFLELDAEEDEEEE